MTAMLKDIASNCEKRLIDMKKLKPMILRIRRPLAPAVKVVKSKKAYSRKSRIRHHDISCSAKH